MPHRTNGRDLGRREVLHALRAAGSATRAELAATTGLSPSAVGSITAALLDDGVVVETEAELAAQPRGRGRTPTVLTLAASALVVGLDFGNSHIRVAVGSVSGEVLDENAEDFDVAASPGAALDEAAKLIRAAVARTGRELEKVDNMIMGVPAPVDATTRRIAVNNILPAWIDVDPAAELSVRLDLEVAVENDANLGALGERQQGAGRGHDCVIYLKVATGIGSGLLLDGRLFRGAGGTAGEIGHVQVEPDGMLCRCGARGCLETLVALPKIVEALNRIVEDRLDLPGLDRMLRTGNLSAYRVVADAGRTMGRALADLCTVLNPDMIVVGGPLPSVNEIVAERILDSIDQFAQPEAAGLVEVRPSLLGDRAEVLGALHLAGIRARQAILEP